MILDDNEIPQALPPDPLAGITAEEWERLQDETEAQEEVERERLNRLRAALYRKKKEERETKKTVGGGMTAA